MVKTSLVAAQRKLCHASRVCSLLQHLKWSMACEETLVWWRSLPCNNTKLPYLLNMMCEMSKVAQRSSQHSRIVHLWPHLLGPLLIIRPCGCANPPTRHPLKIRRLSMCTPKPTLACACVNKLTQKPSGVTVKGEGDSRSALITQHVLRAPILSGHILISQRRKQQRRLTCIAIIRLRDFPSFQQLRVASPVLEVSTMGLLVIQIESVVLSPLP